MKLAVIFGGISSEHDISCLSAASILRNLDKSKYEIHAVGIDLLLDRIVSQKGDTQYGSGGDIFECIKPVDRCRGGIVRADDLDDGARQRRTVLFGYRACYHAVLCRSPAHHCHGEQNEYGQFFH